MKDDPEVNKTMREMLADLNATDARAVEPLLLSLKRMASGDAPPPSPQVFAAFTTRVGQQKSAPWASRHKGVIFSIALIGALGAGTGTAAAVSPAFRAGTTHVFNTIVNSIPFIPHTNSGAGHSAPIGPGNSSPVSEVGTTPTPNPSQPSGDAGQGNSSSNNGNRGSNNGNPNSNNGGATSNNGNGKGGESAQHANPNSTTHPTPNPHSTTHGKNG